MLSLTIYISFIGALGVAMLPAKPARMSRILALMVAVAGLVVGVMGFVSDYGKGLVVLEDKVWGESMGIHFLLAADGISRTLVLLTGIAAVSGVLFSWNIEDRTNEFFGFFLALF